VGADELDATCLFYLGFIAFACDDEPAGSTMLHAALTKTRNHSLVLIASNRLIIYYLSKENFELVNDLALATETLVSKLPMDLQ
jgi:hypothetical protein